MKNFDIAVVFSLIIINQLQRQLQTGSEMMPEKRWKSTQFRYLHLARSWTLNVMKISPFSYRSTLELLENLSTSFWVSYTSEHRFVHGKLGVICEVIQRQLRLCTQNSVLTYFFEVMYSMINSLFLLLIASFTTSLPLQNKL